MRPWLPTRLLDSTASKPAIAPLCLESNPQQFGHLRKPQIPEQPHSYHGFSPTLTVSIGALSAASAPSRRHSIPIHPPR